MTSKISLGAILLAVQCMLFSCISSSDETVITYDDILSYYYVGAKLEKAY